LRLKDGKLVFEPLGKRALVEKGRGLVIRAGKLLHQGDFANEVRQERSTELILNLYEETD
jgi:hypothetical protein